MRAGGAGWRRCAFAPRRTLPLPNHALTRARNPGARCLLQFRLARTLAPQNERGAVLRALAATERHLSDAGTDRPAWCSWVSEAVVRSVNLFQPGGV